jgi:hypothetical protein
MKCAVFGYDNLKKCMVFGVIDIFILGFKLFIYFFKCNYTI